MLLEGIDVRENFSRDILESGYYISQVISSFLSSRIQPRNSILIVIQIVTNFPISICIIQHEARTPRGVTSPVLHRTHPPSPWNADGRISSGINDSHVSTINYGAFTTNGGKASGTGDGQGEDALRRRHFDNWKPMRRQWEGFQAKNQPFRPSFGP